MLHRSSSRGVNVRRRTRSASRTSAGSRCVNSVAATSNGHFRSGQRVRHGSVGRARPARRRPRVARRDVAPAQATTRTSKRSSRRSCSKVSPPPVSSWPVAWRPAGRRRKRRATPAGCPGLPRHLAGPGACRARLARPHALEPGDVLVAPITDPSWTPLFVPAAGCHRRRRCAAQPRHHREPRARHPLRGLRHRRDASHPRRSDGRGQRRHRHGHRHLHVKRDRPARRHPHRRARRVGRRPGRRWHRRRLGRRRHQGGGAVGRPDAAHVGRHRGRRSGPAEPSVRPRQPRQAVGGARARHRRRSSRDAQAAGERGRLPHQPAPGRRRSSRARTRCGASRAPETHLRQRHRLRPRRSRHLARGLRRRCVLGALRPRRARGAARRAPAELPRRRRRPHHRHHDAVGDPRRVAPTPDHRRRDARRDVAAAHRHLLPRMGPRHQAALRQAPGLGAPHPSRAIR